MSHNTKIIDIFNKVRTIIISSFSYHLAIQLRRRVSVLRSEMKLSCFVIILLIFCESSAASARPKVKFLKLNCRSSDNLVVNMTCRVKSISRKEQIVNIEMDVLRDIHLLNVSLNLIVERDWKIISSVSGILLRLHPEWIQLETNYSLWQNQFVWNRSKKCIFNLSENFVESVSS